ncbi:hypothetical protein JCM9492_12700 [Aquifex pyrophilus]
MRFLLSADVKSNKPLFYGLLTFILFGFLFWIGNFFYYDAVYGLSVRKLSIFFFGEPDFPEKVSLSTLFQEMHIFLFINFFFVFLLFSITNLFSYRFKYLLAFSSFTFLFLQPLYDVVIYLTELKLLIYLKNISFFLYQLTTFIVLALTLYKLIKKEKNVQDFGFLKLLIGIFSLFAVIFTILNFFLFKEKLGLSPESVKEYYLGDPKKFLKPKSLEGLIKVSHPHTLSIPAFYFALGHFLLFTPYKRKTLTFLLLLVLPLFESLSGFFIRYVHPDFSLIKLLTFFLSSLLTLFVAFYLLRESLKP